MNRRGRRKAKSEASDAPIRTVRCTTCNCVVCKVSMGLPLAEQSRITMRAFRTHCASSGCVKAEDIEPVELPE